MRVVALDAHRVFCEVAVAEGGSVRGAGRVATTPEALERFARELGAETLVALESTANAVGIARVIEPFVERVMIVDARSLHGGTPPRAKTDGIDARTLARVVASGMANEVWRPDEAARRRRRLTSRRQQLVRQRTREKNQLHAVLHRNLLSPPATDVFGVRGRRWLGTLELALDERLTLEGCLRQVDVLDGEIGRVEAAIAAEVLGSPQMRLLLTIQGVNAVTACALVGAIGPIERFPSARHLVAYLGLDPRVAQSGVEPARHGRISKQGPSETRHVLVEAAWHLARSTGPLRAFHRRVAARRGANIATVAVARKLAVICFHMLQRGESYAFGRPSLTREKLRRLELMSGASRQPHGKHHPERIFAPRAQHDLEREVALQAETAYLRLMSDWQKAPSAGASATGGRASSGRQAAAARQTSKPQ